MFGFYSTHSEDNDLQLRIAVSIETKSQTSFLELSLSTL